LKGVISLKAIPLYEAKEPLAPAIDNGYGYQGVLLLDAKTDKVQCHICGDWFSVMGSHLKNKHKTNARKYKIKYGLRIRTALCSEKFRVTTAKRQKKFAQENPGEMKRRSIEARSRCKKKTGYRRSMETINKHGVCPEQLLLKIRKLAQKLKRTPTCRELQANKISPPVLYFTFGNYRNAIQQAGLTPRMTGDRLKELSYQTNPDLCLKLIQDFRKRNKRWPLPSDFRRTQLLPSYPTLSKYFGSVRNVWKILGRKTINGRWGQVAIK